MRGGQLLRIFLDDASHHSLATGRDAAAVPSVRPKFYVQRT